ncbi:hypothetical protein [Geomonas subterranea]|uniref:Uncharacterized protein n=1 Tax=Geomonas subterranea TaxID=2847989 RepID=A0ABX8LMM1_9BACT|nr:MULTISPECIES: hypothetical protein [Geomonas]QXE91569.1 hypothetical protein KP001_03200 [Geomonas subterranea]QXM10342.1 hypothetical protein KP002_04295 [Geomonas subterranea]
MKKANLEVLLEDMNSKFDLVLEGHEVLRSEIQELRRRNDERFDLFDFKIDTLSKRVGDLDGKVETLDKKVGKIAAELSAHRADTEAHPAAYRVMEKE